MSKNAVFMTLVTALIIAGGYGIKSIFHEETSTPLASSPTQKISVPTPLNNEKAISDISNISTQEAKHEDRTLNLTDISQLLESGRFIAAVELLDSSYQKLSTQQLREFEMVFLSAARELRQQKKSTEAVSLLSNYSQTFNSLEGWTLLSTIHLENKDWQSAIMTLLNVVALEYQPDKVEIVMTNLVAAASHQRALMEKQNDELGINQLYNTLHASHPSYARFQLELALSYLRLDDTSSATNLLTPLQYDAEYGAIAQSTLSNLESKKNTNTVDQNIVNESNSRNEIVVPLLRSGNSFFANTVINNRQLRLLLDTGASITALSKSTIESLQLKPTGRSIKLSTANGITQSKLYRADQIRLGELTIKNLVVASIEFDENSQIHGLLGTDLLNQLDNRYSYIIDNQRNALIFESKRK